MSIHIYGIRHHGPGSARSLRQALEILKPDALLVEGPPDADAVLPLLTHEEMEPPVALLVYQPEQPQRAAFYPFAIFSPEWQALHYGLSRKIAVRFMDLPQAQQMALPDEFQISNSKTQLQNDPLGELAQAAGFDDRERWWEQMVEQRRDGADLFAALREAMAALREEASKEFKDAGISEDRREALREAWMRQTIRTAQAKKYKRIAVVCGAWHAPALTPETLEQTASSDAALLAGLPQVKVQATWTPWTYGRLSYQSGYGAGIESPGWYHHLWTVQDAVVPRWLARVAQLLRAEDLDVSSAHVIESVRLAETLAALRERPLPGLPELNEAVQSVYCCGDELPLRLIHEKLIVGETLGSVPAATPLAPLPEDLQREQKRLRLKPEAAHKTLDLDLRKETDLERSRLLHRLNLLGVPWGAVETVRGKSGTFHELWQLRWQPEFVVALIEAGVWGNTIAEAAGHKVSATASQADLPALTGLLNRALLAALPQAVGFVMARVQAEAAVASDIGLLMEALPPLAEMQRYSDVRQTDAAMVGAVTSGLIARICIGLPGACASLNDEAAEQMCERVNKANGALALLQNEEHAALWRQTLAQMSEQNGLHGLLAGRCVRLLLDAQQLTAEEAARRLSLALSTANEPVQAAAWVEGFLKGSGLLLLHDEVLWQVLDEWVTHLPEEHFVALLPLLRRTFATFTAPERRQMGERAKRGMKVAAVGAQVATADFDLARAEAVLPLVARLLGLNHSAIGREQL